MESNTGPASLQRSPPRQPKADGRSSTPAPEPITGPIERPTSSGAALLPPLCERIVGEDGHGAVAVASPPGGTPPPPSPQSSASYNTLEEEVEEEEWEISKIIGKRRAGRSCEYKVRWRSTWLPRSELGNAQQLLQEFEAQVRAQRGCKMGRSTRATGKI